MLVLAECDVGKVAPDEYQHRVLNRTQAGGLHQQGFGAFVVPTVTLDFSKTVERVGDGGRTTKVPSDCQAFQRKLSGPTSLALAQSNRTKVVQAYSDPTLVTSITQKVEGLLSELLGSAKLSLEKKQLRIDAQ